MDNSDSDYRYMATSDLLSDLQNSSFRADYDTQKKLCRAILKLLKDTNSEVQGMAMKCLPYLAAFVDVQNTIYLVEKLLQYVIGKNVTGTPDTVAVKAMRDVSALGLKSIVLQINPSGHKATTLAPMIVPALLEPIANLRAVGDDADILIECLEVLHEILKRMGGVVVLLHRQASTALFKQLTSPNPLVRKRTISCLGALGAVCDNLLFRKIVARILEDLRTLPSPESIRTGVQAIRALSKSSGHRLSTYLPKLAPILFDFTSMIKIGEDDDLRENCLQALESFCLRCRREMVPFAERLVQCVIEMAKYDPNYVLDDEDEEDNEEEMEEVDDMDDGYDDDDDYSDDDDTSWKVRRAAVKCMHAAITSQLLPSDQMCSQFGPFLVTRFREREEQVKLDVFSAFTDLLRSCSRHSRGRLSTPMAVSADEMTDAMAVDADENVDAELEPLISRIPQLIKGVKKELGAKSSKTRIKAMTLTRELVTAIPSIAAPLMSIVIKEIEQGLLDSATAMKTETLVFLRSVVKGGGVEALEDRTDILIPRVLAATDDRYYKVTSECLKFCGAAVLAFGAAAPAHKAKLSPHAISLYDAALRRATAQDQDSEVKEAALHCLGGVVSRFGPDLGPERLGDISGVFRDRLGNEVTRLATVRAMHLVAISESADVLMPVMSEVTAALCGFLRKNNPPLRSSSLELLCVAPDIPSQNDHDLIPNISELICDTDLRLASLALKLASKLIKSRGRQLTAQISAPESVYARSLKLSTSPLLQGKAIPALLALFRSLAEVNAEPLSVQRILDDLTESISKVGFNITSSASKSAALYCIAKCVVVVCDAAEPALRAHIAQQIVNNVTSPETQTRIFSLACLGELGQSPVLSHDSNEREVIRTAVLTALDGPQEEVKIAAALALGGLSSRDGPGGLPSLISLLNEKPDQRYLLLLSLKEAISSMNTTDTVPLVPSLIPVLLEHPIIASNGANAQAEMSASQRSRASEEESVRTATAECLGLLMQLSPDVMKSLTAGAISQSTNTRALVPAAVRFAVSTASSSHSMLFSTLRSSLGVFIKLIEDEDVTVAKHAVQAVNAIAKSRPSLLLPHLANALPLIYARTPKDKSLIRVVDLGPFKHEEDFGLDLRKSAFDCLRTLVSGSLCSSISIPQLLEHTVVGLRDQSDVRSIAQLIVAIAASTEYGSQIAQIIDPVVRALEETFNERLRENAVRQEAERHEDSIRGALRAVRMMESVAEISSHHTFQSLLNSIVRTRFNEKYESIGKSEIEMLTFGGVGGVDRSILNNREDDTMAD